MIFRAVGIFLCYNDIMVRHLKIRDFLAPGRFYHIAAPATVTQSHPESEHDHDFYEVFWVDSGSGMHWINGGKQPLLPGMLALIRDSDSHALTAETEDFRLVNIAFPKRCWGAVLKTYFAATPDPMAAPLERRMRTMGGEEHRQLRRIVPRMAQGERSRALLDHFLMEVFWIWISQPTVGAESGPMPDWLAEAIRKVGNTKCLRGGTDALAEEAGRSADHVARAAKRWLGKTPTELINDARMEVAARLLTSTDRSILDIADDCGLPNLAHFYKVFGNRFGCTPRRFRVQHLRIVGGALAR